MEEHKERDGSVARAGVRVQPGRSGEANVATGLPVLDHLLTLTARYARFDLSLEVAPGNAAGEVASAGRALGEALAELLRADGARGYAMATMPASEALASVVLEVSETPLVVSNVDLSEARLAGLGTDLVDRFLRELAAGARLTLHLRLVDGSDTQHVLEAIFKALGVALAEACAPR
jgi:imidazoleglycerol-phosphate dehydratase